MKRLREWYWALQVGTFKDSKPYFLLLPYATNLPETPRLFKTRGEARRYKDDAVDCPEKKQHWRPVRVQIVASV